MKRLVILSATIFVIALSSCSKDDDLVQPMRKFPHARTSNERSFNDALTIAQKAISLVSSEGTRAKSERQIDLTQTRAVMSETTRSANIEQDTLMYIFNFADDQGFAIVPKSKNAPELLAVTTKGYYDGKETDNEGFNMYMNNARLIVDPDTMVIINPGTPIDTSSNPGVGGGGIGDQVITEWKTETDYDTTRRGPLLTTKWGQEMPFNYYCFENGAQSGTKNTPAGCTAIAVAQIMAYHEFPNSINLTYSFAPTTNLTLNWDYWKENSYNDPIGLAIFIRELGERLNMDYQLDGSSSSIVYARNVLRDLSYNTSSIIDYNIYDNKIVPNNIADNLPVYIRGYDVLDSVGHAWIIDGYMFTEETSKDYQRQMGQTNWTLVNTVYIKNTYYSFNWGHHGSKDGWFFIEKYTTGGAGGTHTTWANVFDPRNTGNDYNTDVRLINNIFPNN
ncbi:MAG: C10 family peptidase [Rikenellaceae bacterium]|nr:C10 family peptidase [Rikenellaceae bacterium]MBQ5831056.1 C10 family peptidase [Alistipes sp.]